MAKRTNKTSHVLNLLTAPAETEEKKEERKVSAVSEKMPETSYKVNVPHVTVVDKGSENEAVSGQIRENLLKELESEQENEIESSEKTENMIPDSEEEKAEIQKETVPQNQEETEEAQTKEIDTSTEEETVVENANNGHLPVLDDEDYCYINVMEEIIRRRNPDPTKYGACGCKRCRADMMALILTNLPAKYMIMSKDSVVPLLNYYENKYRVAILTATMKACIKVKENPRHKLMRNSEQKK